MIRRSSMAKNGFGLILLVLLVGCQLRPGGASVAQAPALPAAAAAQASNVTAKSANQVEIWGQVPKQCLCHGEPLARVATDLLDSKLPVSFSIQPPTEGWQRFSVTFDPAQVSQQKVEQILVAAGAQVVTAPN
jgi:hypothetical protein